MFNSFSSEETKQIEYIRDHLATAIHDDNYVNQLKQELENAAAVNKKAAFKV